MQLFWCILYSLYGLLISGWSYTIYTEFLESDISVFSALMPLFLFSLITFRSKMNTVIAPSEFHLDCCLSVWCNLNKVSSVDFLFEYNLTIR